MCYIPAALDCYIGLLAAAGFLCFVFFLCSVDIMSEDEGHLLDSDHECDLPNGGCVGLPSDKQNAEEPGLMALLQQLSTKVGGLTHQTSKIAGLESRLFNLEKPPKLDKHRKRAGPSVGLNGPDPKKDRKVAGKKEGVSDPSSSDEEDEDQMTSIFGSNEPKATGGDIVIMKAMKAGWLTGMMTGIPSSVVPLMPRLAEMVSKRFGKLRGEWQGGQL